jgi:hypothetical protein
MTSHPPFALLQLEVLRMRDVNAVQDDSLRLRWPQYLFDPANPKGSLDTHPGNAAGAAN